MIQDSPTKIYWSTRDLANEFNVSRDSIYNWEKILNIKPRFTKGFRKYNAQQYKLLKTWNLYRKITKTDLIIELMTNGKAKK